MQRFAGSQFRQYEVPASNPSGYVVWQVYEANLAADGAVTITDLNQFVSSTGGTEAACREGM